jgi:hypothetical protein
LHFFKNIGVSLKFKDLVTLSLNNLVDEFPLKQR